MDNKNWPTLYILAHKKLSSRILKVASYRALASCSFVSNTPYYLMSQRDIWYLDKKQIVKVLIIFRFLPVRYYDRWIILLFGVVVQTGEAKNLSFLFCRILLGRAAGGLWRGLVCEHVLAFDHKKLVKSLAKEVHFRAVAQGQEALLSLMCVSKWRRHKPSEKPASYYIFPLLVRISII